MYVKRLYDHSGAEPRVTGLRVMRASAWQNLSPSLVDVGVVDGWATIEDNVLTIREDADTAVSFQVVAKPGHFCCHCEDPLPTGDRGAAAQAHVAEQHKGIESPDPLNPAGYRQDNFFRCRLLGDDIDTMTPGEAKAMDAAVRDVLVEKLRGKYSNTRDASERRRAAKEVPDG